MKRITIILLISIILGVLSTILIYINKGFTDAALFFIAYESFLYPVFKGLENNFNERKIREIMYVGKSDNPKLLECKINKKLAELNKGKFTIIDIKIIQSNNKRRNTKEAYILYY